MVVEDTWFGAIVTDWDGCNGLSGSVAIRSLSLRLIPLTARVPGSKLHEAETDRR